MEIPKIKFIDLFAGIGGFHKAFEEVAKNNNFKIDCVFVSEIDEKAIETYTNNFSINKNDIINIRDLDEKASLVPEHDFLFAGFPCQSFSNAGNKAGFLDKTRGTLFFDILKILENKKPKYILLENVKHLVKHDKGTTWKIINDALMNLGYLIPENPLILSPHKFGIPQERYRVFIPGILKEKTNIKNNYINLDFSKLENKLFSNNKDYKLIKKEIEKKYLEKNPDIKYFLNKNNKKDNYLINVFEAWEEFLKNIKWPVGKTLPVIWLYEFNKDYELLNLPKWKEKYILDMRKIYSENKEFIDNWMLINKTNKWKKREQKFEWQAGKDINSIYDSFIQLRQSGIRCKRPTKFPTLVAMVQIPIIYDKHNKKWRYLTPREVANLQCFPKEFKIYNEINNVNNDFFSYKQFGNSVNIYIVKIIQEYLLKEF